MEQVSFDVFPFYFYWSLVESVADVLRAEKQDEVTRLLNVLELDLKEKNLLPPRERPFVWCARDIHHSNESLLQNAMQL